jgi:hypothetical protein
MESNFIVQCHQRNRIWTFERRTGAWFTAMQLGSARAAPAMAADAAGST